MIKYNKIHMTNQIIAIIEDVASLQDQLVSLTILDCNNRPQGFYKKIDKKIDNIIVLLTEINRDIAS